MTKIERLKHRFASGMEEGRISSDEWKDEFLPMIEDAERFAAFVDAVCGTDADGESFCRFMEAAIPKEVEFMTPELIRRSFDAARTTTKEPT